MIIPSSGVSYTGRNNVQRERDKQGEEMKQRPGSWQREEKSQRCLHWAECRMIMMMRDRLIEKSQVRIEENR